MMRLVCTCLLFAMCRVSPLMAAVQSVPFEIDKEVTIRTGNWFPLPTEDMKAAAVDTALDEITKGGLFSIREKIDNKLRLEISLIGPAETAKLTIHVNIKGQPSYVSTASISVHDMDYRGIYNAFEHIGRVAAQRLNDKTRALAELRRQKEKQKPPVRVTRTPPVIRQKPAAEPSTFPGRYIENIKLPQAPEQVPAERVEVIPDVNNSNLQEMYDLAQKLKRQYQYHRARILFEKIVTVAGPENEDIGVLAKDELKYGLTVFEAKQAVVSMGSGDPAQIAGSIRHAENLYRQILAENRDSLNRTQEAQAALDNLLVSRNALKNVIHAQTMATASYLRVLLTQEVNMTGMCPDEAVVLRAASAMRSKVSLRRLRKNGSDSRYDFVEQRSGNHFTLVCDGMQFIVVR